MVYYKIYFHVENVHMDGKEAGFYSCRYFESKERDLDKPDEYREVEREAIEFILKDESIFADLEEDMEEIIENHDIDISIEELSIVEKIPEDPDYGRIIYVEE